MLRVFLCAACQPADDRIDFFFGTSLSLYFCDVERVDAHDGHGEDAMGFCGLGGFHGGGFEQFCSSMGVF